jgi:hypothetical protein
VLFVVVLLAATTSTEASIVGLLDGRAASVEANVGLAPGDSDVEMPIADFGPFDSSLTASESGDGSSAYAWATHQSELSLLELKASGRADKLVTVESGGSLSASATAESMVDWTFELTEPAIYRFSARVFATKDPPVQGQHRSDASVLLEQIGSGLLFAIYAEAVDGPVDVSDQIGPVRVPLPEGSYRLQATARAIQNSSSRDGMRPAWAEFDLRLAQVPEPSTMGLLAVGAGALCLAGRRCRCRKPRPGAG